jgi:hypothetical protein
MSAVISLRLRDDQRAQLDLLARRSGKKPSEVAARLLEEGLRMASHPYIEFRDSMVGRQAYVSGSSLAVWEVALIAREFPESERVAATARHLDWPAPRVQAALRYADDFAQEIDAALADNDSYDFARLARELPGARQYSASMLDDATVD